jgi:hypothetical protein
MPPPSAWLPPPNPPTWLPSACASPSRRPCGVLPCQLEAAVYATTTTMCTPSAWCTCMHVEHLYRASVSAVLAVK